MTFLNNIIPIKEDMTDVSKAHTEEIRGQITEIFEKEGSDIPEIKGTAWAAFNAVSQFSDHFKSVRKETPDRRLNSIWFGTSADMKQKAWDSTLAVAKVV